MQMNESDPPGRPANVPGVVGAGQVAEFDTAPDVKPDTLEGVVADPAQPQQAQLPSATTPDMSKRIMCAVMMQLAYVEKDETAPWYLPLPGYFHHILPELSVIPRRYSRSLKLSAAGGVEIGNGITFHLGRKVRVSDLLEGFRTELGELGDFFLQTDEAASLQIGAKNHERELRDNDWRALQKHLPSLRYLKSLVVDEIAMPCVSNPYLLLLCFRPEDRPFLYSMLEQTLQDRAIPAPDANSTIDTLSVFSSIKQRTDFRRVLAYAKSVGDTNVNRYLRLVQSLDDIKTL
jgi:hypothetical protein